MGRRQSRRRGAGSLLFLLAGILPALAPPAFGQDSAPILLEAVVADVGGEPVTLRETLVYASLLQGRLVRAEEREILRDTLPRLVDQEIIRQEVVNSPDFSPSQPNLALVLQSFIDHAGGDAGFRGLLAKLQVDDGELQEIVESCSRVLDFQDTRIRPFLYVTQEEARAYYTDQFLPALPPGAPVPSFDTVADRLTPILEETKVDEEFHTWLDRRKKELKIRILMEF